MPNPPHPASRDKLPTVVQSLGEETTAGPPSETVAKLDVVPTRLAQYKVLHKLGQGGMGWVLLAEDTHLGRQVALKVMRQQSAGEKDARERFLREACSAAALKHDHIITIYQVGEDRGVPFLAMELLEGGTLQQRLEYPKPLALAASARIAREIAQGLEAAHARGVIHRDIKPANIWLESPKGRVKILDFGLARQSDVKSDLTQKGEIVGTPHYMAPEQARGKTVDARSDLFSLGCILYRMTTGRLPFAGDSLLATLTAIAVDMPQPVRELNPQVPPALADLIWRLLAKDPSKRPDCAQKVIEELSALERDLAGGAKSGFNIEVPPIIQVKADSAVTALPQPKRTGNSSARMRRPPAGRSATLPWIISGAIVAALIVALGGLLIWLQNTEIPAPFPPPPTRDSSFAPRSLPTRVALDRSAGADHSSPGLGGILPLGGRGEQGPQVELKLAELSAVVPRGDGHDPLAASRA